MPVAGSAISIFGRPHSMTNSDGTGILILTVEDIVYNPGTAHVLVDSRADTNSSPRRLQVKKRKRVAVDNSGMFAFISILCNG